MSDVKYISVGNIVYPDALKSANSSPEFESRLTAFIPIVIAAAQTKWIRGRSVSRIKGQNSECDVYVLGRASLSQQMSNISNPPIAAGRAVPMTFDTTYYTRLARQAPLPLATWRPQVRG
jgi:hypothetical protein